MPKTSIPAAGEAMSSERSSSKQDAFQVVRWIEGKLLLSCTTAVVRASFFRNLSRPIDRLRSMWGAKQEVEQNMTAAGTNGYKGAVGLPDETRLAQNFAKMRSAVDDALAMADDPSEALWRLQTLANEIGIILCDFPQLKLERVSVNEHGVHLVHKTPGFRKVDVLRDTIIAYRQGANAFRAMSAAGAVTSENEDAIASETYEKHERALIGWKDAARTREGAIEALKLMAEEDVFIDGMGEPLRLAVLRYLENLERQAAVVVSVPTIPLDPPEDALADAIEAYRCGNMAFIAIDEHEWPSHGGEDAVIAKTYGRPLEVLQNWEQPALTRQAAIEALRLAREDSTNFDASPTVSAMVAAALAYFENEGSAI
ncbi:hypothetical protein [Rhizobium sp. BK661]|uniref:hypothetical protein n=1 Tax=Rhizobium sp. BK661 TaxID=2586991 RepID=UPI002166CAFF|nr:hypothetical protein [Rhizobium sp. BK661]MCS3742015.1 hypothetical protein [Rhizobium sp. BK661]